MAASSRAPAPARGGAAEVAGSADPIALPEQVAVLSKEKAALVEQVAALKEALARAKSGADDTPFYDPAPAELTKMAERCELRWDTTPLGPNPPSIPTGDLEKLELSESEREVIDRKMAESQARIIAEIRSTYTRVTGDENTGSLAPEAMFAEVRDKTTEAELQRVFQRLARERAGMTPPAEATTPVERLFRALTSEGDRLEQSLATELGAETARNIRALHGGWGDRNRSSQGCP